MNLVQYNASCSMIVDCQLPSLTFYEGSHSGVPSCQLEELSEVGDQSDAFQICLGQVQPSLHRGKRRDANDEAGVLLLHYQYQGEEPSPSHPATSSL